nr:hypothetical protein Iba_chr10dCG14100 [Ipomoea batatas]
MGLRLQHHLCHRHRTFRGMALLLRLLLPITWTLLRPQKSRLSAAEDLGRSTIAILTSTITPPMVFLSLLCKFTAPLFFFSS